MLDCLQAFKSAKHYENETVNPIRFGPSRSEETPYRCKHGHVYCVRVIKVEHAGVGESNLFGSMALVETILSIP